MVCPVWCAPRVPLMCPLCARCVPWGVPGVPYVPHVSPGSCQRLPEGNKLPPPPPGPLRHRCSAGQCAPALCRRAWSCFFVFFFFSNPERNSFGVLGRVFAFSVLSGFGMGVTSAFSCYFVPRLHVADVATLCVVTCC